MALDARLYIRIPRDNGVTSLNEAHGSFQKVKQPRHQVAASPLSEAALLEPIQAYCHATARCQDL